jgi:hypothetical protein
MDLRNLIKTVEERTNKTTSEGQDEDSIIRERVAHHESGHAVGAAVLGLPLEQTQIIEYEENGHFYIKGETEPGLRTLADVGLIEDLMAVLFSGLFSATKYSYPDTAVCDLPKFFTKKTLNGATIDLFQCHVVLSSYDMEFFDNEAFGTNLSEIVEDYWPAIQEVAERLLETTNLSGDEVRRIVAKRKQELGEMFGE